MSKTVDSRVVEMRFDNKHFENNVKTSMSTLEKLKQSLKLKDSSKGLENLGKTAKKVDMAPLGKAVDTVHAKFSALEVIGVTALANITNSAVNAGKRIVSALTIDPIKTGFQEYETQINSVQTILANTQSKGSTLKDVNAALEELNKYADQTIYNFTEMTRNIGTFTAAGVDLDTSVNAIKGIANLAAVSGSTSQQASTAMYQLSQALASGTVKLMDWNSVVNAGMGGQVFQDALKETARTYGIAIDDMIEKNGSFRETLKDGWLTSEILTDTLQKFTLTTEGLTDAQIAQNREMLKAKGYTDAQIDEIFELGKTATDAATKVKTFSQMWDVMKETAQSGWSQTWKLIFGDFEEAKSLFTPLTNFFTGIIQKISDFRNNLLEGALSSPLGKLAEKISNVTKPVTEATEKLQDFGEIVNKVINGELGNGQSRFDKLTEAGYDWAHVQNLVNEKLGDSTRHATDFSEAQAGVSKQTSELTQQIVELSDAELKNAGFTEEEIALYRDLEKQSKETGVSINDLIKNMNQMDGRTMIIESFKNVGSSLVKIVNALKDAWFNIFPPMTSEQLYNIIAALHEFSTKLVMSDETADKLRRTFEGLFAVLDIVLTIIGGPIKAALKIFSEILGMANVDILSVTAAIGDIVVGFRDWIDSLFDVQKIFGKLLPHIKNSASALFDWIETLKTSDNLSEDLLNGLINGFSKGFELAGNLVTNLAKTFLIKFENCIANHFPSISPYISQFIDGFRSWINELRNTENLPQAIISGLVNGIKSGVNLVTSVVMELGTSILNAIKSVLGIHSPSTEFFEIGSNVIQGFVNGLQNGISGVLGFFKGLGQKCIDFVKNIDFGKVFAVGISIGILALTKKVIDVVEMFGELSKGLGELASGAGKLLSDIGDRINPKKNKFKEAATAILELAVAIGIVAGSVYLLAQLDAGKLWSSIGAIAALSAIIVALGFVASKVETTGKDLGKLSLTLMAISGSLLIMAMALKKLEFLNGSNTFYILTALATMILGMSVVLATFGTFVRGAAAKNIDKAGTTLMKMSLVMLSLATVIKIISTLEPGALKTGFTCIGMFGAFIVALITATNLAGENIDKVGGTILKISAAMLLLVGVIMAVSMLSPATLTKGIICMTLFGGLIAGLMATTKLIEKDVNKVGSTILGISAAIVIMTIAIRLISGLEPGAIAKGVICIGLFGALIVGLVAATKLAGENIKGVSTTILMMSLAVGALAAVAILLSLISIEGLTKGIIAVGLLSSFMALMIYATKGAENCKGNLVAMTVAIGIMAAAVLALSFIDPSKLAGATAAMATVMGMFALMTKAASSVQSSIGALIVMTVAVGLLAGIIYVLASLQVESVLSTAASLSMLLLSMSVSLGILTVMGGSITNALLGIVGLLAMAVPLLAFVGVLALMQNIQNATANAIALSVLATAMSLLLIPLSLVGVLIGATGGLALLGIVGLLAMAVPLVAFVGVLALMQNIQGATENVQVLTTLMTALTDMLVKVSILGPLALIGVTAITALMGLIAGFTGFVMAIGALFTHVPMLQEFLNVGLPVMQQLAGGIGSIIGSFISGLAVEALSGLPQIASSLSAFIVGLNPFITGIKMVDPTATEGAKSLAEMILILTGANILEGLTSWLTGGTSLTDFGKQIAEFAPYLAEFAGAVAGIDAGSVTAAANAGKLLAEMASALPNSGGVASWFAGENDLDDFGKKLSGFGTAIADFSAAVDGKVNEGAVKSAANAGKVMAELANTLPNSGGVSSWFAGENDIDSFGSKLVSFGTNIALFSQAVDGKVDEGAVKSAANAGKAIAELANSLPNGGGASGFFAGNNDIDVFGTKLVSFGNSISIFSATVSGTTGGLITIAEDVKNMCKAFDDLATLDLAKGFTEAINKAKAKMKTGINNLFKSVKSFVDSNKTSLYKSFYQAGDYAVQGLALGIAAKAYLAIAAARALANTVSTVMREALQINSPSKVFMSFGGSICEGLAKGITDNAIDAVKASKNLGGAVLKATQDYLGIHSPSVVFNKEVGRWIVKGIEEGLKDCKTAEEKAEKMASNIVNAFKNELDKHDRDMSIADNLYKLWETGEGKDASDYLKDAKQIEYLEKKLPSLGYQIKLATDKWQTMKDKFGEASKEAEEALIELQGYQIELNETWNEIGQIKDDSAAREADKLAEAREEEYSVLEDAITSRDKEFDLWDLMYDEVATDSKKDEMALKRLNANLKDKEELYLMREEDYLKAVEEHGLNSKEAREAYQAVFDELIEIEQIKDDIAQVELDAIERETQILEEKNAALEDRYSTLANNYDLEYQLWEKINRNATDEEKDVARMASLEKQMAAQAQLMGMSQNAYLEAVEEFGDESNEAYSAYSTYLQDQLSLANLQSEILDIQEAAAEREQNLIDKQKNAKSEYAKYMEKYRKYYLANGMTEEDLERDARLVSGYDPSAVIKSSSEYKKSVSELTDIGTTYGNAINSGVKNTASTVVTTTSSILTSCVDTMKDSKADWVEMGSQLVESLIEGISSKTQDAVDTIDNMITSIITAMNADFDGQPTIRPVLDLSNVETGVTRLNSMLGTSHAIAISNSMASSAKKLQNGAGTSTGSAVVNYVQNNYSPKALSATEIYRQTNTQLASVKEVLK